MLLSLDKNKKTSIYAEYPENYFTYKGYTDYVDYEVPYKDLVFCTREYFQKEKDIIFYADNSDLMSFLGEYDILDKIECEDKFQAILKERCKEDAKEALEEEVDALIDSEMEDFLTIVD